MVASTIPKSHIYHGNKDAYMGRPCIVGAEKIVYNDRPREDFYGVPGKNRLLKK
jgi:hypothetical protein